ncbi:MAG: prolipoprotein diacylglyceryl transferase [Desulfobacterales bacterium]|nr:prolipoprotein diacylglyceryl transferase [Desulfobacterales bacterium]
MQNVIFITVVALVLGILYFWGFKHLPHERWQILGTIPIRKEENGQWQGLNLTYYGLINACAVTFALFITFLLLTAVGLPLKTIAFTVCGILILCVPSAKWIARLVEKKKHTFTIGGASFCGLVGAPLLLLILQPIFSYWGGVYLPVLPFVTAMAIGYAFGEGSGRLACLSFGCCYGKPIDTLPPKFQRWASYFSVVFQGETKKAAYADGLNGCRILAIQAVTSVIYSIIGLVGIYLFLHGHYKSAYLSCIFVTQIWRILSEFVRADFRGSKNISIYQYLSGIVVLSALIYSVILPEMPLPADLSQGLRNLWHPELIVLFQFLWVFIFLFTGRSEITAARISFFVRSDRI